MAIKEQIDSGFQQASVEEEFVREQKVMITEGPFSNFSGVIDEISHERGKLKVLVVFWLPNPCRSRFRQGGQGLTVGVGSSIQRDYSNRFSWQRSQGLHQVASCCWKGQPLATNWTSSWPTRRQHHGVLQGIQRSHAGTRYDHSSRDHGLQGPLFQFHHKDPACLGLD